MRFAVTPQSRSIGSSAQVAVELLLDARRRTRGSTCAVDDQAHRHAPGQRNPPAPAVLRGDRCGRFPRRERDALHVGVQRGVAAVALDRRDVHQPRQHADPRPAASTTKSGARESPAASQARVGEADALACRVRARDAHATARAGRPPAAPPLARTGRSDRAARCRSSSCAPRARRRSETTSCRRDRIRRSRRACRWSTKPLRLRGRVRGGTERPPGPATRRRRAAVGCRRRRG